MKCPKCNSGNREEAKFCDECGHNLTSVPDRSPTQISPDDRIRKIQRYLPKGLTEKVLAQKDKIERERKQVTVMFCDMEGFTPLVEKLGPEKGYSLMDQIYGAFFLLRIANFCLTIFFSLNIGYIKGSEPYNKLN